MKMTHQAMTTIGSTVTLIIYKKLHITGRGGRGGGGGGGGGGGRGRPARPAGPEGGGEREGRENGREIF